MARNWQKFRFDELCHLWTLHKKKDNASDPLGLRTTKHPKLELTKEEIEELVDFLLIKLSTLQQQIDGLY